MSRLLNGIIAMPKYCILRYRNPLLPNYFIAWGDFCHLLITFAISLDPDQDRQSAGPDLNPNCLTLDCIPERIF